MRKKSYIPGIIILSLASILFSITLVETTKTVPDNYMGYLIIGFTVFGIYTGLSIGKKTAYTIHDRELMSERTKGHGAFTSVIGSFINLPFLFATVVLVGWTVFMLSLGFVWQAVTDEIFLRTVRWIAIAAMMSLIMGSYMFYRAKSSSIDKMLSFWGKKSERQSRFVNEAMKQTDYIEEGGVNLLKAPYEISKTAEDMKKRFL